MAATGTNQLTLAANDATTITSLTVTGSGSVDLSSQGLSALKTFTAGDGGVKLRSLYATASEVVINTGGSADTIIAAGAGIKTLNTGAGNDIVTIASTSLAVDASVNLGDGDDWLELEALPNPGSSINGGLGRDTLAVTTASFNYTPINNAVTGIEVLAIKDTGLSVNLGNLSTAMTEFLVANTGTTSFSNATKDLKFEIANTGAAVAAVNITNAMGQNATSITLNNQSKTSADLSVTALTIRNDSGSVMTVALSSTSTGGGTGKNIITTLIQNGGSTINITGSTDLTITNLLVIGGGGLGSTVNASAFTGKLSIKGSVLDDRILGGSGADSLSGGVGDDTFFFNTKAQARGAAFAATDTNTNNIDKITDFLGYGASLGDQISLGASLISGLTLSGTPFNVEAVTVATAADFTALTAGVSGETTIVASTNTVLRIYDVTVTAGNLAGRYLIINDTDTTVDANDFIVSITGITDTLHANDFLIGSL